MPEIIRIILNEVPSAISGDEPPPYQEEAPLTIEQEMPPVGLSAWHTCLLHNFPSNTQLIEAAELQSQYLKDGAAPGDLGKEGWFDTCDMPELPAAYVFFGTQWGWWWFVQYLRSPCYAYYSVFREEFDVHEDNFAWVKVFEDLRAGGHIHFKARVQGYT